MRMGRLALITMTLNLWVVFLALGAWLGTVNEDSISALNFAGLLAIIAFSLMLVHFLSEFIKDTWFPNETTGWQYPLTRWVVLFAILAHPLLINYYLFQNNYGLPPGNYQGYFGVGKSLYVYLGATALICFLAYEFKRWFEKRDLSHLVFHSSILAMFLILIHGFQLGSVTKYQWYYAVWWLYAVVFTLLALRLYIRYYAQMPGKRTIAIIVVLALAGAIVVSGLAVKPKISSKNNSSNLSQQTSPNQQQANSSSAQKTISLTELSKNNGKNGSACWLAIDGVVYDVSGNRQWKNGEHIPSNGMAKCGEDLTEVIKQSPHGKSVLGNMDIIGKLQ